MEFRIKTTRKGNLLENINFRPFLEDMAKDAIKEIEERFTLSKDPNGREWAALKYRSGRPLVDTGTLSRSFEYTINKGTIVITTSTSYGRYHQFGTSRIPQRAFMGFSDELRRLHTSKLTKYINSKIN